MIRVHDGGVRTTVQDAGRFGLYHLGMPPSGALDDYSFRAANLLVGTVISFVVAYAAVAWLLRFVATNSIAKFVPYRLVVGALVLVSLAAGWLSA